MNRSDYVLMGPMALMRRCEGLERDKARLDFLESEMKRELTCTQTVTPCRSLFRRNVPITREAIDEAMAAWNVEGGDK